MVRLKHYDLSTGHVETIETYPESGALDAELALQQSCDSDHGTDSVWYLSEED